jgi:hypothetical protein
MSRVAWKVSMGEGLQRIAVVVGIKMSVQPRWAFHAPL